MYDELFCFSILRQFLWVNFLFLAQKYTFIFKSYSYAGSTNAAKDYVKSWTPFNSVFWIELQKKQKLQKHTVCVWQTVYKVRANFLSAFI